MAERGEDLHALEAEDLVSRLTAKEVRQLIDENEGDPDDPSLPASVRTAYRCEKATTGAYDREKLMQFLENQVRRIPNLVRGKKERKKGCLFSHAYFSRQFAANVTRNVFPFRSGSDGEAFFCRP